jgi:hypothetical protein
MFVYNVGALLKREMLQYPVSPIQVIITLYPKPEIFNIFEVHDYLESTYEELKFFPYRLQTQKNRSLKPSKLKPTY